MHIQEDRLTPTRKTTAVIVVSQATRDPRSEVAHDGRERCRDHRLIQRAKE